MKTSVPDLLTSTVASSIRQVSWHQGLFTEDRTRGSRFRGRDKKQQYQPIGEALEFDEAKRRAEEWLAQLTGSPVRPIKRGTVIAALETYLSDLRRHDRSGAAAKAEGQFKTALGFDATAKHYTDLLCTLQLEDVTNDDFLDWRDRLRPGRLPRTVNRLVRAVTAGLNRAHRTPLIDYTAELPPPSAR
ncbi:MAG: hypothetical protein JWO04_571 [Gammaproteobacteria bacterium]|nr:hypothetical protein [Gammaproteobacteria bacterium]